MRVYVFDAANLLYCFGMCNIASKAVNGIGWVNDDTTVLQAFDYLLYQPWLGVIGVNIYQQKI